MGKQQRTPRSRPLLRLALIILLGAATTVLVSWSRACIAARIQYAGGNVHDDGRFVWHLVRGKALAWELSHWNVRFRWVEGTSEERRREFLTHVLRRDTSNPLGVVRMLPESQPRTHLDVMQVRAQRDAVDLPESLLLDEACKDVAMAVRADGFAIFSYGFPWKAMWRVTERPEYPDRVELGSFEPPWIKTKQPPFGLRASPPQLPLRVHAAGFIANTAVFGGAWWTLLFGAPWSVRVVRQWRRRRRGLCPRCAYDISPDPSAGCSECGWGRHTE